MLHQPAPAKLMISTHLRTLLEQPKHNVSVARAVKLLDINLRTVDDDDEVLDRLQQETHVVSEQLSAQVCSLKPIPCCSDSGILAQLAQSQKVIDAQLSQSRLDTQELLTAAEELALMRHSLADELTNLSNVLVSAARESKNGEPMGPTLLEQIETLHRNLKELQSVKGYVDVVFRALALRYEFPCLCFHCR